MARYMLDAIDLTARAPFTVAEVTRQLLTPAIENHPAKAAFITTNFGVINVKGHFERDPRTKVMRPVNFDVVTPAGTVRCGSTARTAAAFVVGVLLAPDMK